MAKILQPGIALPGADQRLSIHCVNDLNQLKMGGAIFNAAFEYDVFSYEHYLDAYNMGGVNFFLAEFAGLPIGACMTISDDGLMEVAWVAVLTGYRKRGIAGRLINTAKQYAIKDGKSISVLSAFEGGINAYRRVGYKAYCKIDVISYIGAL